MKTFRWFAALATAATYFLIFMGGLVRVSGAGLGCPDWPRCFGSWIPPLSADRLPPDIDPALFNFTLAWIEYINRLIGVAVGLLIVVVAVLAMKYYRKVPKILIPSLLTALLVAFQGWQGGRVVASELEPLLVSVHMAIAFLIVSLLIYVTQQAYYHEVADADKNSVYPKSTKIWVGILWLLVIFQVIMGTQVRSAIENLAEKSPLLSEMELLSGIGDVSYFHTFLGILITVAVAYAAVRIFANPAGTSSIVRQSLWTLMGLTAIQLFLGIGLFAAGIPAVVQVLHLWTASLIVGTCLILYTSLRTGRMK